MLEKKNETKNVYRLSRSRYRYYYYHGIGLEGVCLLIYKYKLLYEIEKQCIKNKQKLKKREKLLCEINGL